jgi:hypothetical protein
MTWACLEYSFFEKQDEKKGKENVDAFLREARKSPAGGGGDFLVLLKSAGKRGRWGNYHPVTNRIIYMRSTTA